MSNISLWVRSPNQNPDTQKPNYMPKEWNDYFSTYMREHPDAEPEDASEYADEMTGHR